MTNRRRREPERGRGARVTGLRPYPCFCDDRQDRPAGKGMESGVCQADRREGNANRRYLALKGDVKEAEQIRRSVYNILRQEQREQQPRRAQDMER